MPLPAFDLSALDPKLQLLDLDRADCEESLYEFLKNAWKYIDPSPWKDSWAVDAICEHLQAIVDGQIKQLIINCPPRIGKSSVTSVAFPAWTWAQSAKTHTSGPGVAFLYASYADKLSLRDSVKCRRLIESPWYRSLWGDRYTLTTDQNTKSRFTNDQGGERLITSISSGVTGEGGNCFIAGTKVSTPSGHVNIEEIIPGDVVLAFDLQRGMVVKSRVLATAKRKTNDLCTLHETSGHRFICTPDHPIYSPGRGFIPAAKMGKGDGLLVCNARSQLSDRENGSSYLRQLWSAGEPASVLGSQSAQTGKSRCVLQQEMLLYSSHDEKLSDMPTVQKSSRAKTCEILLRRLQIIGARIANHKEIARSPFTGMRVLQKKILRAQQNALLLFREMLKCCSFVEYDGCGEFEVSREFSLFQLLWGNALGDSGERRELLRNMWQGGNTSHKSAHSKTEKANVARSTSYRRESEEQRSEESHHALHSVSSASSHGHIGSVREILCHSGETVDVYDIQVEGQSNFFANDILVHNCIVIDDPNAANDMMSEATVEATLDWWKTTMPTRRNDLDLSAIVIIQQRLAENDLTGHILEKEIDGWTHLCLPGRYEPERSFITTIGWKDPRSIPGELLWPERFSEEALKKLEVTMGPFTFAGQIQQRPEPQGGGIIKRDWWQLWEATTFPNMEFVIATLDTAYTTKQENDPSAMIVWGIFSDDSISQANRTIDIEGRPVYIDRLSATGAPKAMMMHAWTARLELHELVEKVAKTAASLKVDVLLIENKASGISVAQEIRRLYQNERFSVQLFDPKSQDKMARLYSVQHLFAEGLIYAPDRKWAELVMKQCGQFPKSSHDDLVDCTSMGLRTLRDMGLLTRGPERSAELEAMKTYPGRSGEPLYPA